MIITPVFMVREEEDGGEYLSYDKDGCYVTCRPATIPDLTLEAMADFLDQDAESANAHGFVGVHRTLAAILYQQVGRVKATVIFRRLLNYRGLHGSKGVCGYGDAEAVRKELGLPKGSNWKLGK